MKRIADIEREKREYLNKYCPYQLTFWKDFDYSILEHLTTHKRRGYKKDDRTYNDVIIMADTETSKSKYNTIIGGKYEAVTNYVVAWTISFRAYHTNIVTLYGRKPSEFIECLLKCHKSMKGDDTYIYFHNLAYDWWFLRKFFFDKMGTPEKQLNVKPHYPIFIEFYNGIKIKDSLILAQRSLDKWSKDMNVEHQKAKGLWDYDMIRNQDTPLTDDELEYIEHDTLAGVECLDATLVHLNKTLASVPYTATGIPREQTRKYGKPFHAHDYFKRLSMTYEQQQLMEQVYHGGYTHANRYLVNEKITGKIQCYDFASSYPYCMLAYKYADEKFTPFENCKPSYILSHSDNYVWICKLVMLAPHLISYDIQMPALQLSKMVKILNPVSDNGRVIEAEYVEIYVTNVDLEVIMSQYTADDMICVDVQCAHADYLPKWFTDYIYECFKQKTILKGGDPVAYSIAKATVNSLYGMCVQKPVKDDIVESYEESEYYINRYEDEETYDKNCREKYEKYLNNRNSVLLYHYGVFVTAYAFRNLFKLGECCETWIYSDTDSCYGMGWNVDKINAYNQNCIDLLNSRGYGGVYHNGRYYYLGVAEHEGDKDTYTEFKTMGAKRYCGRCVADGEIHITVAGVPKSGAKCLNNNIDNFQVGFIFDGKTTNKKTHTYMRVDKIYIDDAGNEIGDSIDLTPCDYLLDSTEKWTLEDLEKEVIEIQVYEE